MLKVNISMEQVCKAVGRRSAYLQLTKALDDVVANDDSGTFKPVGFEVEYFGLSARTPDAVIHTKLPCSVIKLTQGKATSLELEGAMDAVADFLGRVRVLFLSGLAVTAKTPIEPPPAVGNLQLFAAEVEKLSEATDEAVVFLEAEAKAVEGLDKELDVPVDFDQAVALSQRVILPPHFSATSVSPRVAAVSETSATKLIIDLDPLMKYMRLYAAGPLTPKQQKHLKNFGFQQSIQHQLWGLTLGYSNIGAERVLGAVLFDLNEAFPLHVESLKELLHEVDAVDA